MSVAWQKSTHGVLRRQEKINRLTMMTFVIAIVVVGVLGVLYLGVEASSSHRSSEILRMHSALASIRRESNRLDSEIARLGSIWELQTRSVALGYQPAERIEYVDILLGAP